MGWWQGFSLAAFSVAAISWWVVDLELSPLRLVLLGTALEVAVLVAESPTGVVADVYSRKWSMVISWLLLGTAQALMPVSDIIWLLWVWQALWGFGYTFQSGADTAWVTDEVGEPDDDLVLRRGVVRSIGVAIGITAAMVATQWSVTGTIVASGLVSIAFAGFLALAMPEQHFQPVARRSDETRLTTMARTWWQGARKVSGHRLLRIIMVSVFVASMADELVDRLDFARLRELGFADVDAAGSALWFGGAWLAMTLITIPAMIVVNRRARSGVAADGDQRSALLLAGLLTATAVGVGAMAGPIFALAIVGWVVRDVAREVAEPLSEAWTNRHAPPELRATVLSFRTQAESSGEILGGVSLGLLADYLGLAPAFAAAAVALAVAAALTFGARGPAGTEREPVYPSAS
jgi:DHA3 family tetracycline resistance protein-like MFS transporter